MSSNVTIKMDDRCPRGLKTLPCSYCPLAVARLKSAKYDAQYDEFDEAQKPGCDYAINSQMANYCFFKYVAELLPTGKPLPDMTIAHLLNIPLSQIKGIEQAAIEKLSEHQLFKDLKSQNVDIFDAITAYHNANISIASK